MHGLTEINAWAANTGARAHDTATLKKAFWFHDAVYGGSKDGLSNEEQSARLWLACGLDGEAAAKDPAALIRATEHGPASANPHRLQDAMLGADLAILGQPADVYDDYARSVRVEYGHVDEASYRAGRGVILAHFLANAEAGILYADDYFRDMYGATARENLARELNMLK